MGKNKNNSYKKLGKVERRVNKIEKELVGAEKDIDKLLNKLDKIEKINKALNTKL